MKKFRRFGMLLLVLITAFSLTIPAMAAAEGTGFSDVDAGAWYAEAVTYCRDHNLMSGVSDGRFDPESSLTRAQLAMVLYRIAGTPAVCGTDAFTDMPDGIWYGNAVLWASQQNLVSGYGDGLFGPEDAVSREQMTAILWRYARTPSGSSVNSYSDRSEIAGYASAAVDWSSANSIVAAESGSIFAPKSNATRAQIAAALMNFDRMQQAGTTEPAAEPQPESGNRTLIAYFSATNNTENIANHLADILNADLHEITPETPYTSADLDYGDDSSRTSQEMNDPSARTAISGSVENMQQYQVVFLGYPIWWGQAPKIISTFLESYDLGGKTIVPFCTSGSSGIGSSAANLHSLAGSANWLDGRRFSGSAPRSEVENWVTSLNLTPAA